LLSLSLLPVPSFFVSFFIFFPLFCILF
jgi:hypothetical protein